MHKAICIIILLLVTFNISNSYGETNTFHVDKLPAVGVPLDNKLETFLLEKLWCNEVGGIINVSDRIKSGTYTFCRRITLSDGTFIGDRCNKVIIRKINDEEFVITYFKRPILDKTTVYFDRNWYKIIDTNKLVETKSWTGKKKEGKYSVLEMITDIDKLPPYLSYKLCGTD